MKKIDCKVYMDILPLYVDGALSNETKMFVEEHLLECEACRDEVKMLSRPLVIPVENNTKIFDEIKKQLSLKNAFIFGVSLTLCVLFWLMLFPGLDTAMQYHILEMIHGGVRALWILPLAFGGIVWEWRMLGRERMWWTSLVPTFFPLLILCFVEVLWSTGVEGNRNLASLLWYIGFPLILGACLAVLWKILLEQSMWIKAIALTFFLGLFAVGLTIMPERLDKVMNLEIGEKAWYVIGEDTWWNTSVESLANLLKSKRVSPCEQAPVRIDNRECVILRLNEEYVIAIRESESAYVYSYKGDLEYFEGENVVYKVVNSRSLKDEMEGMLYMEYNDDKD